MNNLPSGWFLTNFSEVLEYVQRGKSPKYADFSDLPVINQKCVRWWGIEEEFLKYIRADQHETYGQERFLQLGDVLWNSTGTGTIGRAALYSGLTSAQKAVVDGHVTILRSSLAIAPNFLFNFIRSPNIQNLIEDMQSGSTNQVELSKAEVLKTEILLPPLPEQQRIVKKLDALNSYISTTQTHLKAVAKLVERYKAAVLDSLLPLPNSTIEDHLLSTFYGPRFSKDSYVESDGVPTIRTTDFSDNGTASTERAPLVHVTPKELEKWGLQRGDILVTRTGSIGKCAFFDAKGTAALPSAYLIRVRVETSVLLPRFAFLNFVSPRGQKHLGASTQAVAQPNINAAAIRALPIGLTSLDEQREIVHRIETAFTKIDHLAEEAEKALKLTDSLDQHILAQAFSGELVPQDPSDEPASILLTRIKKARESASKKPRKKPTKTKPMKISPQDYLLTDSANWPKAGLSFEEIAKRITLPYDDLKDAVFKLLEGNTPKLRQEFDSDLKVMKLMRVAS